ncbi:ShlB/FhaC/HecB family hemolysin secretion/activation protein [Pseudodesulfovibrio sp. S3]|uniref:ShlB/FhaC/HecB family hemolysin secretion/activation protein n=1 Tax=Pseudodesulfovibrio sp. S3 TaxID=2283629 RepID=UPI001F4F2C61|nr:ShlB/FhaC/HecB family hemolysin secretion/activation protein [Pseudodesulfovibrio sp. S3]MCJ2164790.1 ShlB/FhaC/HecB family hemolysin secretion/activation protein [Pseudodesulfovibrio sp. S3-i]
MCIALFAPSLCCGAPIDDAIRQQQQIQQQQEQRRQELERQHLEGLEKPPSGEDLRLPEVPQAAPGATCFQAKSIELKGVTLLSRSEVDSITKKYLGKCLTLNDVNNLVRDVTNAYIDKGYVTTRAVIPQQDLSAGHLVILVVEGKVEGIEFKDGQGAVRELRGAFPGIAGEYLNLRDIEQGLDQMNRLPSNNAKMELVPGDEPGTSRIVVENEPSRSWRLSAGLDNSGQDSTGRNQYILTFGKDNLLEMNDLLDLHINGDAEAWTNGEHQKSGTINGFYSIPLGYWTFSTSLSRYDYRTTIKSGASEYSSAGNTTTTSLSVDRVLRRDANSKTSLGLSYTHRDTQNYFSGVKLAATSQVLAVAGASLNHSHRLFGGLVSGQVGISHGLPILGAERDRNPAPDTPRAQFSKVIFGGSYYRPFTIEKTNFTWSTRFSGQWSEHTLYSAERISIGSRYTVRGFHEDSLSGDTGVYIRNELAMDMTGISGTASLMAKMLGKAQLYAGYDAGIIKSDDKELEERGSLQGAVLGVRTSGGNIVMDMAIAKPLDAPASMINDDLEFYTSIQYAF